MKSARIILILGLSFSFFCCSISANTYYDHEISIDNLDQELAIIYQKFQADLDKGIGVDSLRNFLRKLLPKDKVNNFCVPPQPHMDSMTSAQLLFKWPDVGGIIDYGMSCLNFENGNSAYQSFGENKLYVNREDDVVCLFAFHSKCSMGDQSILHIIIVDKDIVEGESSFDEPIIPKLNLSVSPQGNKISLAPNPFNTDLMLHLDLIKNTSVKLRLFNGYGGSPQAVFVFDGEYAAGQAQLNLNLPTLAPGWYYVLLEVDGNRQVIPLVKLNSSLP